MINWLGNYNYDYVLASIPIQLILLILYCLRRNLPIRSSYSFLWVMIANLVMTIFDVAACEMNAVWETYPLWAIYGINEIYFIAFIVGAGPCLNIRRKNAMDMLTWVNG